MGSLSVLDAAKECPSHPAIITAEGTLTFEDAARRTARTMAWLTERGIAEGSRVGLVAHLRVETLIAIYALIELGIPIVLLHPRLTPAEREALVAKAPVALILDESWTDEAWTGTPPAFETPALSDERCLAIAFTSGTSGAAKAVVLSRAAFAAAARASEANLGWRPDDRWLLSMPLAHVGGLGLLLRCLAGRKTVVIESWSNGLGNILETIDRRRVTLVSFVPTMLTAIFEDTPNYVLPAHVRAILLGGDRSSPSLLAAARERRLPTLTTYGMTETCAQVSTQPPGESPGAERGVGFLLQGVSVSIRDEEILVRGPTLLTGYLVDERIVSPFTDDGWFATGDRGELDSSGRLFLHGRKKDLIITGGENVDPSEVEDALLLAPSIAGAVVFGVADERWGELVAAAIVPRESDIPDLTKLAEQVASVLAAHKRPRLVAFCDKLPVNASNKVDRRRVAAAVRDQLVRLKYARPAG